MRPIAERRTIVLQPLGDFTGEQRAVLVTLQRATTLYFGLPVEIAASALLPRRGRRVRQRQGAPLTQYLTGEILNSLSRTAPLHAIAYLGVYSLGPLLPRHLELARLYEELGQEDDARWLKERSASLMAR